MEVHRYTITPATTRPLTPPGPTSFVDQATEGLKQRGVVGTATDVFVGAGEAVWDLAKGLGTMIAHPLETGKGLCTLVSRLVTNPGETCSAIGHAFTDSYVRAVDEGRPGKALGRGIVEIGSLFISPTQIARTAKASASGAKAAIGALRAGEDLHGAFKAAMLASEYTTQASGLATQALKLSELGYADEAAKVSQYARVSARVAEAAKLGEAERAFRYAGMIDRVQTVNVGGQAMSLSGLVEHAGQLVRAGATAVSIGSRFSAKGLSAAGTVSALPAYEKMMELATRTSLVSPYLLVSPRLAVSMGMLNGTLPSLAEVNTLTPEKVKAMAEQYNLEPTLENVKAFLAEAGAYPETALGPNIGTPDQIKQLQAALRVAGYDIQATGTYDEATCLAVMSFKNDHNPKLHQSYKQKGGEYAVNEYVDQQTAAALYELVNSVK